ncbi:MAG TPA: ABC transporter substrate-binding protein [Actinophytocola sp.]|nr:ABC transporter substrate-binding protein [Actinophytocola sp.]
MDNTRSKGQSGKRWWPLAAGVVVVGLAAAACGGGDETGGGAQAGGAVAIRLTGDWDTLDPALSINENGEVVSGFVYDNLLSLDDKGEAAPYLANTWKQAGTAITFDVRTDATCSDGTKLTPEAIAGSLKRTFDPATKAPLVKRYFGEGPFTVTADASAHTVTVDLGKPHNTTALYGFTQPVTAIVCPAGLKDPAKLETGGIGSGPYTLTSSTHGQGVELAVRKDWAWGPQGSKAADAGFPSAVHFKVVDNDTTAANLLLTGGLDIGRVGGTDVPRLKANKDLIYQPSNNVSLQVLVFNQGAKHATADPAVRQALMMVVNPKEYIKAAFNGLAVGSTNLIIPDRPCYDENVGKLLPDNDLDQARKVLENAGYTRGADGKFSKNGKPLTMELLGNLTFGNGPDYIASQFEALGVTTKLDKLDQGTYLDKLTHGTFDSAIHPALYASLAQSIAAFLGDPPPDGTNYANVTSAAAAQQYTAALAATSQDEQCGHLIEAESDFIRTSAMLPLASITFNWFGKQTTFGADGSYVKGWSIRRK